VRGTAGRNKRATPEVSGSASLTPDQQAGCLLDMATDENILGRAFMGWRPWL